jgi:glycosyltransferase involved in cell wall biosynthesis
MSPPFLSVIVPVHNDPERLRACLASLAAAGAARYEVIVVDDASTDATRATAGEMGVPLICLEDRVGPASARNRGAERAAGQYLLFIDADISVRPDTLEQVAAAFTADPALDALFGSYDTAPAELNLLSQYKNLFHHFVHQSGREDASTFWSGCGAIRRALFLEMGGFSAGYGRPSIEDIELGARLRGAGRRIALRKDIQVTHLKRWTFWGILRSDVWDRGVPWTRLLLRERSLPNDLNLRLSQRVSALFAWSLVLLLAAGAWWWAPLLLLPTAVFLAIAAADRGTAGARALGTALALFSVVGLVAAGLRFRGGMLAAAALVLGIVAVNRAFYAFFLRERGPRFVLVVLPMHILYYAYSGLALAIGAGGHLRDRLLARARRWRRVSLASRSN